MILFIIFLIILGIGTICCILEMKSRFGNDVAVVGWISGHVIGGVGLFTCLTLLIVNHSTITKIKARNNLDQKIESLNATKTMILQNADSNSIIEITNYNTKVAEYKEEIKTKKAIVNSIWVGWYVCPIYKEYTGNEIEYIQAN